MDGWIGLVAQVEMKRDHSCRVPSAVYVCLSSGGKDLILKRPERLLANSDQREQCNLLRDLRL